MTKTITPIVSRIIAFVELFIVQVLASFNNKPMPAASAFTEMVTGIKM
jgi:hypothetical protein